MGPYRRRGRSPVGSGEGEAVSDTMKDYRLLPPLIRSPGFHRPDTQDVKRGDRVETVAANHTYYGTVVSVIVNTAQRLAIVWDGTLTAPHRNGPKCSLGLIDREGAVLTFDGTHLFRVIGRIGLDEDPR